jgi:phosphoenolpyruvate carboxylase
MSTQHPDNVQAPFFAERQDMSGEDEVQEAYYAYSHLGCDEQMWDCEGKEVDTFVVRKLLTRHEHFFRQKRLGRDLFLTLRVPNPDVEKREAKVLIETLESIPRSCDAAEAFYGEDSPPIFEVILPMTLSAESLNRIHAYYQDFVVGKESRPFYRGDITIAEWIGGFHPRSINVIPLFEDRERLVEAGAILREYLSGKAVSHQRVFLARSDPALNYGMVSAILLNKIALQRLRRFSENRGVAIHPILGVGSPPFRGHLTPENVERVMAEYPDVQTFTIQSAFKYDNPVPSVIAAVAKLKATEATRGRDVDEGKCLELIDRVSAAYRVQVEQLAPLINTVAAHVPKRRTRKLHVGLFGYGRNMDSVSLPRAIGFCAACYSLGLPPEILGLNALTPDDLRFLRDVQVNFSFDMQAAMAFFNDDVLTLVPEGVKNSLRLEWGGFAANEEHRAVTSRIIKAVKENDRTNLQALIVEAAHLRRFLG